MTTKLALPASSIDTQIKPFSFETLRYPSEYLTSSTKLVTSEDGSTIYNPTSLSIFALKKIDPISATDSNGNTLLQSAILVGNYTLQKFLWKNCPPELTDNFRSKGTEYLQGSSYESGKFCLFELATEQSSPTKIFHEYLKTRTLYLEETQQDLPVEINPTFMCQILTDEILRKEPGVDINASLEVYGLTPLHLIAQNEPRETFEFLVNKMLEQNPQANINPRIRNLSTLLHWIAQNKSREFFEFLVNKMLEQNPQANINPLSWVGGTPLHFIAKRDNETFKFLENKILEQNLKSVINPLS